MQHKLINDNEKISFLDSEATDSNVYTFEDVVMEEEVVSSENMDVNSEQREVMKRILFL